MFAEKSDKLLKNISSEKLTVTKFCYKFYQHWIFKLNKHKLKYIQLGILKRSFYNIKTNNKLVNS